MVQKLGLSDPQDYMSSARSVLAPQGSLLSSATVLPLFRCLCAYNSVLLQLRMPYIAPITGYLYNNVMKHHENLLRYENEVISEGQANSGGPQI